MNHTTALPNLVNPHSIQRLGTQTDILGECPLWDAIAQCLYWVDIRRPAIRRFTHATGEVQTWTMPEFRHSPCLDFASGMGETTNGRTADVNPVQTLSNSIPKWALTQDVSLCA